MQERSHDGPHDAAPGGLLGAPCRGPRVRSRSGGATEPARRLRCCAAGCEAGRAKSCERERGSLCLTRTNSCDRERSSLCLTRTSSLNVRAEILGLADRHHPRILALFGISKSRSSMRESKRSRSPRVHSDQEWEILYSPGPKETKNSVGLKLESAGTTCEAVKSESSRAARAAR